ncbi:MAG: hypothetical protein EAZ25_06960 [Oscillatoriales cyanobacterium]|nr:MAG: hypothetical protein EAZ25_06960 [Oscillatoriales cyanobacterium]
MSQLHKLSECYFLDQDFHRWYPPRDLSVESIPNRKSKILSSPEFIRGVNLKFKYLGCDRFCHALP